MLTNEKIIRLIFGFKVRHLRQQKNLSYQELAKLTGLSTSYLNDIEKGKRYPKPAKITNLANALDVDYNYMVATNASKKLQPIIDLLSSKFFRLFPLEDFGISLEKLLELFTQTPDKVNAFISTIFKIARNYQVNEEQFYLEALRSYQDMHNNHFPKLEEAVENFKKEFSIKVKLPYTSDFLEDQLLEIYDISIDREELSKNQEISHIRSFYKPETKVLYIQKGLLAQQQNFLIARELGFQYLQLQERPYETTLIEVGSFEKLLHNYKASHFAAALLMDGEALANDIRLFARENSWQPKLFLKLLDKYNVSPETLMQRLTNILPHHFGLEDLFFIRITGDENFQSFTMKKDLHLSQLHSPYNNELNEHYCNRWVSITSIKELPFVKAKKSKPVIIADAQISKYWNTDKEYLCISLAKPGFQNSKKGVSVTLGLLVNPELKSIFHFLSDPKLKYKEVHTTCERCGVTNCEARVVSPIVIEQQARKTSILDSLKRL
ncbi:MAG: transcriptional regulator with XRE-family HTH domain [Saprospiraceae bacterium]|jgi:transcriptional regulator with XRE-family HTH domain